MAVTRDRRPIRPPRLEVTIEDSALAKTTIQRKSCQDRTKETLKWDPNKGLVREPGNLNSSPRFGRNKGRNHLARKRQGGESRWKNITLLADAKRGSRVVETSLSTYRCRKATPPQVRKTHRVRRQMELRSGENEKEKERRVRAEEPGRRGLGSRVSRQRLASKSDHQTEEQKKK